MAYGLYQESLKENYGIEDLVKIVAEEKTGRPPQEAGQKAERIKGYKRPGRMKYGILREHCKSRRKIE